MTQDEAYKIGKLQAKIKELEYRVEVEKATALTLAETTWRIQLDKSERLAEYLRSALAEEKAKRDQSFEAHLRYQAVSARNDAVRHSERAASLLERALKAERELEILQAEERRSLELIEKIRKALT